MGSLLGSACAALWLLSDAAGGAGAAAAGGNAEAPQGPSPWSMLLPVLIVGVLFYYMMFRPEQQKRKSTKQMLENLKKNDRVVTLGGIRGVVNNVHRDADEVTVTVDESTGTKLRFTISSIVRVEGDPSVEEKKK